MYQPGCEFFNSLFMYSKMEFESGLFLLLRIDVIAFKIRSSNVSLEITDFIEFVQVSIDSKWVII